MLKEVLTVSALIVVVLLVRAIFKNRIPKRMIYALWLVVLLKLCLPGTLVSLPVLPAEDAAVPAQSAERPAQTTPVIQHPAQTVTKPQTPAQQPVSPVQETAKPAAKPLFPCGFFFRRHCFAAATHFLPESLFCRNLLNHREWTRESAAGFLCRIRLPPVPDRNPLPRRHPVR